jgi:hypothetical protein
MAGTNLVVRSVDGTTDQPIAKAVEWSGRTIVHAYVYGKYQKHSIHAWGLRYPLLRWMVDHDVRDVFMYDAKAKRTFRIDIDKIRELGTVGELDQFGGTLNVPVGEWDVIEHKLPLPWTPDQHQTILPQCAEPWPLPERAATPAPIPIRRPPASARDRPAETYWPNRSDPQPTTACVKCHGVVWWQRDTGEWVCERCHPEPNALRAAWEIQRESAWRAQEGVAF